MKILTVTKPIYLLAISLKITSFCFAQESNIIINQDPKFEQLLNEKRKINSSITVTTVIKFRFSMATAKTPKKP